MNCPHCQKEISESWAFCAACGRNLKEREAHLSGVRQQVLEVIVRQAIAGAPWREICRGPMQVNKITVEDIVNEARARGYDLSGKTAKKVQTEDAEVTEAAENNEPESNLQTKMKLSERAREAREKMQALLALNKGRNEDFERCIESLLEQYGELEQEARDYEK